MRNTHPPGIQGFSLLELVIVIILVALLFTVAMNRLAPLRGDAEAAHVATVIGSLRSAIGLEAASRVVREGPQGLAELEGINPMTLLQEVPEQYVGIRRTGQSNDIAEGSWYFDDVDGLLVYRVRFPQHLEASPPSPVELQWQIRLQFEDMSESGTFDPERDRVRGLGLQALHDHQWTARQASQMQNLLTE